jgi:hypothetical protein
LTQISRKHPCLPTAPISISTGQPLTWCQTPKILARNDFLLLRGLESYGEYFFGQQLIPYEPENYCNCASRRIFKAKSFSSMHMKFPNPESTNTFLMRTNEHYTGNYAVSMHNYMPKVVQQVIKTWGLKNILLSYGPPRGTGPPHRRSI